jgi:hypothetical protein
LIDLKYGCVLRQVLLHLMTYSHLRSRPVFSVFLWLSHLSIVKSQVGFFASKLCRKPYPRMFGQLYYSDPEFWHARDAFVLHGKVPS